MNKLLFYFSLGIMYLILSDRGQTHAHKFSTVVGAHHD